MNLVGDPWIPVIFNDGHSELVSLRDAFARGGEIRDLSAAPPQRIALTRLLVCVAQAALDGPDDEADWRECKPRIAPKVLGYLENHRKAFELYAESNEGAFLQVPNLEPKDNAVVDKLDFGLAAGNNATLFDHGASPEGRPLSSTQQALALLTYQCFSPGGRIGVTRWSGVWTTVSGEKPKASGTSEHAPCLDGAPLHTIVRAQDLRTTIHGNFLTKKSIAKLPSLSWGRPVWETMPSGACDPCTKLLVNSYLGRLVPITRAIRLSSTSPTITICNALSYPKFPETREPNTTVISRKDGTQTYLRIDLTKHPWRELASLLSASGTEGRPLVLHHLRPGNNGSVDLWTGGLATNKGKVLDVAEWSFSLQLSFLGTTELQTYQKGVDLANRATSSLWAAVSGYCDDLKLGNTSSKQNKVKQMKNACTAALFWGRLDNRYGVLVDTADDPTLKLCDKWYQEVREAMNRAYEQSCPHETPRQIQAYVKGNQMLRLSRPEG